MASTAPKTVKQLGQFLQEQQEPFMLETYLSERRYRKKLDSEGSIINSCKENSGKSLKRSGSFSLKNSRKGIPLCPKVLRTVYNKLISTKDSPGIRNNDNRGGQVNVTEVARNSQEVAKPDRCSSASSTTVFNSCSESDVEEASIQVQKDNISFKSFKLCSPGERKTATDRKLGLNSVEGGEQISPVSVLEEIQSHRVSPQARQDSGTTQEENSSKSSIALAKKITEDSLLSASLWKLLLVQSAKEKPGGTGAAELEELVRYKSNSQFFKSIKILQQTKQLLFDCVKEALDNHGKERHQRQNPEEFTRPELLGKLVCDKIKVWGEQSGSELNITRLLHSDFLDSAQEWTDFQPQKRDLAFQIGDAIMAEIRDQIVTDMVFFSKFNY